MLPCRFWPPFLRNPDLLRSSGEACFTPTIILCTSFFALSTHGDIGSRTHYVTLLECAFLAPYSLVFLLRLARYDPVRHSKALQRQATSFPESPPPPDFLLLSSLPPPFPFPSIALESLVRAGTCVARGRCSFIPIVHSLMRGFNGEGAEFQEGDVNLAGARVASQPRIP